MTAHHRRLERMYLNAPVQRMYPGISIKISGGTARIELPVNEQYFHAGKAVHGSVYFRLLDDAAYFAINSTVTDVLMLTSSFHIDLLRPVNKGVLIADGRILHQSAQLFIAESILTDDSGKRVAIGKGTFMKSKISLNQILGYEETV